MSCLTVEALINSNIYETVGITVGHAGTTAECADAKECARLQRLFDARGCARLQLPLLMQRPLLQVCNNSDAFLILFDACFQLTTETWNVSQLGNQELILETFSKPKNEFLKYL